MIRQIRLEMPYFGVGICIYNSILPEVLALTGGKERA